ncbi:MAG: GNAT family N-acetyltransferase [Chloroflexaceae bacterium]|nr:GNAT family N-acetyltransferase [Chloroflexaceae bacterium]
MPAGFTLQPFNKTDLAAWVEMFNQSFIDHYNHHTFTVERLQHYLDTNEHYRPELDLLAIADDGTYAGFCYAEIDDERNRYTGRAEAWIGVLGTRRGYRQIGLGRALLRESLQRLRAAGIERAMLGVDSLNPAERFRFTSASASSALAQLSPITSRCRHRSISAGASPPGD